MKRRLNQGCKSLQNAARLLCAYTEYAHCCYLEKENYSGEEGRNGGKNWYSGGTTPLAGLIIRERDIEKAISDSGNHNLPEVELENIDGCVFV